ncbi:MAG: outer membrane lipoprotein-sorting protein [Janthinobacterium lividum]
MALRPLLYISAALSLTPIAAVQAAPNINSLTSVNIKTLQADSEIVTENQDQLSTINGDIALAYRLHRGSVVYEQPGKLRIEASIPHLFTGYYIINGNQKLTVAPFVHKVQDTTGAPGKRQTLMDFGMIPPELLIDYNATFLRHESGLLCFQIQPKQVGETQKDIVWIDPKTHITVQRYNYGRDGKLTKILRYLVPLQILPGIYAPTRVELYNPQNKLAGATIYQNIRVNQPVSDSLFKI